MPLISSCFLCALAMTSSMLDSSGESGLPCLVPYLRKRDFSCLPLSMMFIVDFNYMAFIVLR